MFLLKKPKVRKADSNKKVKKKWDYIRQLYPNYDEFPFERRMEIFENVSI